MTEIESIVEPDSITENIVREAVAKLTVAI